MVYGDSSGVGPDAPHHREPVIVGPLFPEIPDAPVRRQELLDRRPQTASQVVPEGYRVKFTASPYYKKRVKEKWVPPVDGDGDGVHDLQMNNYEDLLAMLQHLLKVARQHLF